MKVGALVGAAASSAALSPKNHDGTRAVMPTPVAVPKKFAPAAGDGPSPKPKSHGSNPPCVSISQTGAMAAGVVAPNDGMEATGTGRASADDAAAHGA